MIRKLKNRKEILPGLPRDTSPLTNAFWFFCFKWFCCELWYTPQNNFFWGASGDLLALSQFSIFCNEKLDKYCSNVALLYGNWLNKLTLSVSPKKILKNMPWAIKKSICLLIHFWKLFFCLFCNYCERTEVQIFLMKFENISKYGECMSFLAKHPIWSVKTFIFLKKIHKSRFFGHVWKTSKFYEKKSQIFEFEIDIIIYLSIFTGLAKNCIRVYIEYISALQKSTTAISIEISLQS